MNHTLLFDDTLLKVTNNVSRYTALYTLCLAIEKQNYANLSKEVIYLLDLGKYWDLDHCFGNVLLLLQ